MPNSIRYQSGDFDGVPAEEAAALLREWKRLLPPGRLLVPAPFVEESEGAREAALLAELTARLDRDVAKARAIVALKPEEAESEAA